MRPDPAFDATHARSLLAARSPQSGDVGAVSSGRVAAALARARWGIALAAVLGGTVAAYVAAVTPDSYRSEARILVTSGSESIQIDLRRAAETKDETLAAQAVYVLRADGLLRRVVARIGPERLLQSQPPDALRTGPLGALLELQDVLLAAPAAPSADAQAAEALDRLRKQLTIEQPLQSNILVATCVARDRWLAQEVLNAYLDEARRWHQEIYDDPKVHERLHAQAAAAADALAAAQRREAEFLESEARVVGAFELELQRALQSELEAATQVERNTAALASSAKQIEQLQKRLEALPPVLMVRRRVDSRRIAEVHLAEIARLEAERVRVVSESAQPRPDGLEAIERRIASLQALADACSRAEQDAPEVPVEERNPEYAETNQALARLASERVGDLAKDELLRARHRDAAARVQALRQLQPRSAALRAETLRCEEEQRRTAAALAASGQKRELRLGNFSSLRTIEEASLPLTKEGPMRARMVLAGAAASLFAALVWTVLRSLSDTRIRSLRDLESVDGIAVIGMMPRLSQRNLRRHAAARARGL